MSESNDIEDGTGFTDSEHDILKLIEQYVTHTDRSPREQRIFEVSIREIYLPIIKTVLITIGILVCLTWPTDFFLFGYEIIAWAIVWRSGAILFVIGMVWGINNSRVVRRNVNLFFVVLGTLMLITTGYSLGQAAQISEMKKIVTPWFDISFLVPLLTTLLSMRIISRLLSTALMTGAYVFAYLFTFPYQEWLNPYLLSSSLTVLSSVVMCTFLGHVIYHLNRRDFFRERKLEEERQKIERIAARDQLTGLQNYRSFHEEFEREFARAKRYGNHLTLLLVDLDHFKTINDKYGHLAGDQVLDEVGGLIMTTTRKSDISARYGGEEFGILLPDTQVGVAHDVAQRLRENLNEKTFSRDGESFHVTCSIGIAELEDHMIEPEDLIAEADEALYRAKQEGRNQVQE